MSIIKIEVIKNMKRILLILILLVANCQNPEHFTLTDKQLLNMIMNPLPRTDSCAAHYRENTNWWVQLRDLEISPDYRQYSTVVLGDSTMVYSMLKAPNWFNPSATQVAAVIQNNACDMITQLSQVHSKNPSTVIISTADANGLFQSVDPTYSAETMGRFVDMVRAKYPNATIVGIGIHPTLVSRLNKLKDSANTQFQNKLTAIGNTCYIEPMDATIFNKAPGEAADPSDMLDELHYGPGISLKIKAKILSQCGVSF